jgi:uroporphyrinogen decarboxylase
MTPRERVLKAFKKLDGHPDRVPLQFDLSQQLLEHFSAKLDVPLNYTHNLYEDVTYRISGNEIKLALGSDIVVTGAGRPIGYTPQIQEDGSWFNEYGMRMKPGELYIEVVEFPLAAAQTAADIAAYTFPDPNAAGRYDDTKNLVDRYAETYFITGCLGLSIYSLAQQLVGMEKLMLDMAAGAEYLESLFTACTEFQLDIALNLIRSGVDAIWVGDDFGSQNNLLFSPRMFRKLLKHHYVRLVETIKETNPDILVILHSDGAVRKLLPDIVEIGFDVFNPIQPGVPGLEPQEVKDEFGDRLMFWGGIDLSPAVGDNELEAEIQEKFRILGREWGYVIAPAHIVQADVLPERVEKFVEFCLKHGKYS